MMIHELQSRVVGKPISTNKTDTDSRTAKMLRDLYEGLIAADAERLLMLQRVIAIQPTIPFPKIDCGDPILIDLTATETEIRLDVDDWYLINPVVSEPEYTGEIV
jgi:hypothetical protein